MTKKIEIDSAYFKKAADFALKAALKADKKELAKTDKERLDGAIRNFFDSYDAYIKKI
jgi:hypothetical protein